MADQGDDGKGIVLECNEGPAWWFHTIASKNDDIIKTEDPKRLAELLGVALTTEEETSLDAMMIQALNKVVETKKDNWCKVLWDCEKGDERLTAAAMEATALYYVVDWLKRNESLKNLDEKATCLQQILDSLVPSVLHGILDPDAATRATYSGASLLEVNIGKMEESSFPAAIILTGIRKSATSDDIINALEEFGVINEVGVALKGYGFGMVRFTTKDGVNKVWEEYVCSEVVVQDVAANVRKVSLPAWQEPLWYS
ncbi:expressed unknown protein [Seminavis robusta]|uniref:RRM domain-containing protein n=1 Tax=Seminavis robusta TaxID=568900 RepID=A0A9N8DVV3_9STRA|nr:expressed unknown protein [Seminavis robusta]|eukprot:Sro285_g108100.1 n/a (256) ;mRNA; r:12719-13979